MSSFRSEMSDMVKEAWTICIRKLLKQMSLASLRGTCMMHQCLQPYIMHAIGFHECFIRNAALSSSTIRQTSAACSEPFLCLRCYSSSGNIREQSSQSYNVSSYVIKRVEFRSWERLVLFLDIVCVCVENILKGKRVIKIGICQ